MLVEGKCKVTSEWLPEVTTLLEVTSAISQAFSIAEGTIKWLQEDENDRPRYRIRIAEVTPIGKKCATSATLLEVTSALLLEVSPKSLLEVSPKWLREVPPKNIVVKGISDLQPIVGAAQLPSAVIWISYYASANQRLADSGYRPYAGWETAVFSESLTLALGLLGILSQSTTSSLARLDFPMDSTSLL